MRIGAESGFASSTESEQQSDIPILALIGTGVHAQDAFLGHQIVHESEEALLHFPRVLGPQNSNLFVSQVDGHTGFGLRDAFQVLVEGGVELACIENVVVNPV